MWKMHIFVQKKKKQSKSVVPRSLTYTQTFMILRGNRNFFDGLQDTTDDGLSACFLYNAVIFVHSRKEGALRGLMASQRVVLKKTGI